MDSTSELQDRCVYCDDGRGNCQRHGQDKHDIQIIRADAFVEMRWVHVRYAICWTHQWASKATSMQVTLQENVQGHVEKGVKLPHMWDEKFLRIRPAQAKHVERFPVWDAYAQHG